MTPVDQGSLEWHRLRLGHVTSSRVADIVARTKSGYSASRANYLAELLCARLTGEPVDGYTSPAMEWGVLKEPLARAAYEFHLDLDVIMAAYVTHPTIAMTGASPDGLVGNTGLVEIKCPNTATHIDTLLRGQIPGRYETQMLWQMACTGRDWCDYVSFDPRVPERMALFVQRFHRDETRIAELETEVLVFLAELDKLIGQLDERSARPRVAA